MLRAFLICLLCVPFQSCGCIFAAEKPHSQFEKIKVYSAAEAHQAVAVDDQHFYAIANRSIGKYDKLTGKKVASWDSTAQQDLKHLNSGVVLDGKLYCAHSNWPNEPLQNSIQIWDAKTLQHVDQIKFPESEAAITWIDQHQDDWWAAFAFYGEQEKVQQSHLVRYSKQFEKIQKWTFPSEVVERFVPYSCSGGAWGTDGLLYVTGHDRAEVYSLKIPKEGSQLELVDIIPAPIAGQGIAWDRTQPETLYGIRRKQKQVVVSMLAEQLSPALKRWLVPQQWQRDTSGPILSLGNSGSFDDTHMFAPCVAYENGMYRLWYCGSTGRVAERVFSLGLATSTDGKIFDRVSPKPVYSFGDSKHSVLTPTLLRDEKGNVLRENGKLRMWFSATHFAGSTGLHTLHETTSIDGVNWSNPSPSQLDHLYSPTIIKEQACYRMWYVDVSADPWIIRHAKSQDGQNWKVTKRPVLTIEQAWEKSRLFYPTVVKADGVYLMWYGSYWNKHPQHTAIGFAVSEDGIKWHKHPQNPVLRPDPARPWESHYTTSQSVHRLPDGSWRIWYASRKSPPFVNKYYAINTAHWDGLEE